jgi:PAS domain S-box-containing protein
MFGGVDHEHSSTMNERVFRRDDKNRRSGVNLRRESTVIPIRSDQKLGDLTSDLPFRLLVQRVRDYAIFLLDPEGYVLTWNAGAEFIKGYAKEEILGKHFSVFYLPEAVQSGWPQQELKLAERDERFQEEGWRVKKDGSTFWASVTITALRLEDGRLYGFAKVTQDLTSRRQSEERIRDLNKELRTRVAQLDESQRIVELRTLELQKLSSQLLQSQDEERRRIARELHDDLAQQISVLKMDLDAGGHPKFGAAAGDILEWVRNSSYLLHPPLLEETGLRSALHWFVEGLSKRSKVDISIKISPENFQRLSPDVETAIFRVVQEALMNVLRHSASNSARVEIEQRSDNISVRIRDFGKGIPLGPSLHRAEAKLGVGITGMRERVRQFGGELTVARAEPGTLVEAHIPTVAS